MWQPIQDIPTNWKNLADESLHSLAKVWQERQAELRASKSYQTFQERLRRRIAIETGVLERLYTIDRGITYLLIEHGIDESLIPHGATDKPATEVVALIRDHEKAIDMVFDFVGNQRELSNSFIKSLHQLLTRHQDYAQGLDEFGYLVNITLRRGDWKLQPNNPLRPDGSIHYYCPPEQVASQMDQLIAWHLQHQAMSMSPEIEAAWLHHRFTQIHPFQDGNGRVARCLASLVLIQSRWFPLVVTRDERNDYITALEESDAGDLKSLIELFVRAQKKEFLSALSISEEVISEHRTYTSMLDAIQNKLKEDVENKNLQARKQLETFAIELFNLAQPRLHDVANDIKAVFHSSSSNGSASIISALSGDDRDWYHRYQIIETAKQLGYYANLKGYKSWIKLTIRTTDVQTEMLFSFHHVGYEIQNLMVCSGCIYRKFPSDDDTSSVIQELQVLASAPFQFAYLDDSEKLQDRFKKWLEQSIVIGLEYWRRGL